MAATLPFFLSFLCSGPKDQAPLKFISAFYDSLRSCSACLPSLLYFCEKVVRRARHNTARHIRTYTYIYLSFSSEELCSLLWKYIQTNGLLFTQSSLSPEQRCNPLLMANCMSVCYTIQHVTGRPSRCSASGPKDSDQLCRRYVWRSGENKMSFPYYYMKAYVPTQLDSIPSPHIHALSAVLPSVFHP